MKTFSAVVCVVSALLLVGAIFGLASAADEPSELTALVGKWVWNQTSTCGACRAFTAVLTINSVSADGAMSGTYQQSEGGPPAVANGVPVRPRATITDGKIKVALKVRSWEFDLDYLKGADSLKGPVSGFPPRVLIREAEFRREK